MGVMATNIFERTPGHTAAPVVAVAGRVSVVTAAFNAASLLARSVESVLAQDYRDVELVVVDGGSTDGTLDLLARYGDRVRWISEPDRGIYDAWNKGIELATGEWIGFLGADDAYLPGALSAYMAACADTDAEYASSLVRWIPARGRPKIIGGPWGWPAFRRYMTTAHVGSLHRRTLYEQYGNYDLTYRIVGDYELLLRPRDRLRAVFVPVLTAEMQAGGVSDTYRSLHESSRARTLSGGRSRRLAPLDIAVDHVKLAARRMVDRLALPGLAPSDSAPKGGL